MRNRNAPYAICVLLLLLVAWLRSPASEPQILQDDPTVRIDYASEVKRLEGELARHRIEKVEILHIPPGIEFRMNVSSAYMNVVRHYRLTVSWEASENVNQLVTLLKRLEPQPAGVVADLRWGCCFLDRDGARVFSIYFERSGTLGVINGACVKFSRQDAKALTKWAESCYGKAFR